ncbi:Sugar transporter [Dyella jiangningensis]|uniref:MFS transporter n=1 Tax=Dyella sp. AtDHG13 TaxID=1938897 RepID=UPI00088977F7|nr:MFS transporter [Dyella sp. AtDHG13]PXV56939.1 sugar transport protein [Dyella sp. AtDHG13]SDK61695.1 Sugar transporter [Dyella jiangningensis]
MATTAVDMRGSLDTGHRRVILASSLGTVFEWYDFYLYGSLAALIGKHFFTGLNETSQFIFALLAFAAGFAVRPFGAIVFGRLGDMIGRKYTFLITIIIMGLSTFFVGVLPGYAQLGVAAPTLLIALRLLQGLALGGEYGGAATYVAEHAPNGKRGLYTSFIQITATFGLFLSLLVILGTRLGLGDAKFDDWGWRIPFLVSSLLLAVSVYIRMQLHESPVFQQMKAEGKHSKAPLTEAFGQWKNLKLVILALLGATAGQAVVWYTGQFYALYFLTQSLKIDGTTANLLIAAALAIGTPFFVLFGWLSDRIGRKTIVLAGCLLAALTYFPIFKGLTHFGNPAIETAAATAPVKVVADPKACSFQFDPVGKTKFTSSCDVAKSALAKKGIPYSNVTAEPGSVAEVKIGDRSITSFEGASLDSKAFADQGKAFGAQLGAALKAAGYPEKADPAQSNYVMLIVLLAILVIYVTMVYGPIAAWLVEMFPTRIRYTSMSLPYHIGNGWFGGFVPTIGFMLVAWKGDIYYGLWYPIIVAIATFFIGLLFLRETKDVDIRY